MRLQDEYKLALAEGQRAIDDQLEELSNIRQRVVQFLAFVGSATGFLVGAGLRAHSRDLAFYCIATSATLVSVVCLIIAVLLIANRDRRFRKISWDFRVDPELMVTTWIDPVGRTGNIARNLALVLGRMVNDNDPKLDAVRKLYLWFLISGMLQLILWVALVWRG